MATEANVVIGKSAKFFKIKKRITKKIIKETFNEISSKRSGNFLFNKIREPLQAGSLAIHYSLIAYKIEEEPSFLEGSSVIEQKYAFAIIIEHNDSLILHKKNIDSIEGCLSDHIEEYDYSKFCNFLGGENPEYEKITMNNMTLSDAVIRARAYEAKKLNGILPTNSSSRSIPRTFRMKANGEIYTLSPSTSRITLKDKKTSVLEYATWAAETADSILNNTSTSEFISHFAAPITLEVVEKENHFPVALFISLEDLDEEIRVANRATIYKIQNGAKSPLSTYEQKRLFEIFKSPLKIVAEEIFVKGKKIRGSIKLGKKTATLRLKFCDSVEIERAGQPNITLSKYLNNIKPFSIMFDTPQYAYFSRACFEDKKLIDSLDGILSILDNSYDLTDIKSEKEKPHDNTITQFPERSLFRKIEDIYCANDGVLICDDMNDEWADHIFIQPNTSPPSISFIHSKFSEKESSGASNLHEVISQALKNIGRVYSDTKEFKEKHDRDWTGTYESTQITRVRKGGSWAEIESALNAINTNPNTIRRIILSTPFINKSSLETIFNNLKSNQTCKPHHVQLIWLLNTFIGACRDHGVSPLLLCMPSPPDQEES